MLRVTKDRMDTEDDFVKGVTAEKIFLCPRRYFWGDAEYVLHCHKCGELSLFGNKSIRECYAMDEFSAIRSWHF